MCVLCGMPVTGWVQHRKAGTSGCGVVMLIVILATSAVLVLIIVGVSIALKAAQ